MAGDFKMEFELKGVRYVLNRTASEMLLARLDEPGRMTEACERMREDLRRALAMTEPDGREAEVTEEHTVTAEVKPGQAEAACCAWCGEAGEALPLSPGDTEALWVCRNDGCHRFGMPAALGKFAGGY